MAYPLKSMQGQDKQPPAPKNKELASSATYHIQGRTFLVEPIFQEEGAETLTSLLLNLLRAEACAE
ncbi:hypothetical protein [Flavonifractor sp. An91]|uniref:hypothetical protein n=1 Tax=Flavonifractor sp. An91 TaxID=1965665 RepID=UPI000B373661|nr:hypothetical protein [Flavonifractor sp. An91]OUN14263.1 hypothetical protein B5G42_02015 [Flavonifractor sp. An91]